MVHGPIYTFGVQTPASNSLMEGAIIVACRAWGLNLVDVKGHAEACRVRTTTLVDSGKVHNKHYALINNMLN